MELPDKNISKSDIEYFNSFKEGYNPYSAGDFETMLNKLIAVIKSFKNLEICEIGCASGQFSVEFDKRIKDQSPVFTGVDIAKEVLELYPFNRINSSAHSIPVRESSFDIVCFPASLHHLYPFEKAVKEAGRILKKGGLFYCLEPNFFHPHRRYFMNLQKLYRIFRKPNDIPINPYKLQNMLEENHFEMLSCDFININFIKPGLMQGFQNKLARTTFAKNHPRFFMPWFIAIARKRT